MPFPKFRNRIKTLKEDCSGSESTEFLGSLALLLLLVVSLISILAYAYRVNELNYAARRAVRSIEVTGVYNYSDTQNLVNALLPHMESLTVTVYDENGVLLSGAGNKIQLRDTFKLTLQSTYTFEFFSGTDQGTIQIPIGASVQGMSEVYWKAGEL